MLKKQGWSLQKTHLGFLGFFNLGFLGFFKLKYLGFFKILGFFKNFGFFEKNGDFCSNTYNFSTFNVLNVIFQLEISKPGLYS